MESYVVLCDCRNPQRSPARIMYSPIDGKYVIALIDDHRPDGSVSIEQNPPEDFGRVQPNRRGDRRASYTLRCPGCGMSPDRPKDSTLVATLDLWLRAVAPCVEVERVAVYEGDVPATAADEKLVQDRFENELYGFGESNAPAPQLVPWYTSRRVISWRAFNTCLSNLPRER